MAMTKDQIKALTVKKGQVINFNYSSPVAQLPDDTIYNVKYEGFGVSKGNETLRFSWTQAGTEFTSFMELTRLNSIEKH